jgi:hypothetical protein
MIKHVRAVCAHIVLSTSECSWLVSACPALGCLEWCCALLLLLLLLLLLRCPVACAANQYAPEGLNTNCGSCPATTEPTLDNGACQCQAGTVPKSDTSWASGNLTCNACPPGG